MNFLSLNKDQQKGFYMIATDFVKADNQIHPNETEYLESIKVLSKIKTSDLANYKNLNPGKLNNLFTEKSSKKIILFELIGLGYIDNEFSPEEDLFILDLAEKLMVPLKDVVTLKKLVLNHINVIDQINKELS